MPAAAMSAAPWDGLERRAAPRPDYAGPRRRSSDHLRGLGVAESIAYVAERLDAVDTRLDRGSDRMDDMQAELAANTAVTNEVRELLGAVRSGLKVLGWIGTAVVWTAKLVAALAVAGSAVYAFWHTLKTGQPPHQS